jgi:hypothetical protein
MILGALQGLAIARKLTELKLRQCAVPSSANVRGPQDMPRSHPSRRAQRPRRLFTEQNRDTPKRHCKNCKNNRESEIILRF